jgi:lysozyme
MNRTRFIVLLLAIAASLVGALLWSGIWIPNRPSQSTYPISGIDVSHHQGDVSWAEVAASGTRFSYIKATEGADYKDPKFTQNWAGARSANVVRGAYHFYTFGTLPASQAANFIAAVPVDEKALPPAVDLEMSGYNTTHSQSPIDFRRDLALFIEKIESVYKKAPVIYTTRDFQNKYLAGVPAERFWIREVVTRPGGKWVFWQFSPRGRINGISTFVDLEVFEGGPAEFDLLLR